MCYGGRVGKLYSDVILDRFKHPRYLGELDAPDATYEDVNPLCGDRVRIELRLDGGPTAEIEAVRYRGDACAIALAAADLLAEMVQGRPAREAGRVERDTLLAALRADIRPSRLRCVTLPLDVLRAALKRVEVAR
ncbi:MAG: iron-sulfur cluster assembly scaffold protein [Candidatus Rokubacteria bacterium]|nr:iron-sulfur cluster assembly scaffold protein [Candidatus Rokubacteria bacterium]